MAINTARSVWNQARLYYGRQQASILRYVQTGGKPSVGIQANKQLVDGLSNLEVLARDFTVREVVASRGLLGLQDKTFVFYGVKVFLTDLIYYEGVAYTVMRATYQPHDSRCEVIGKNVGTIALPAYGFSFLKSDMAADV